MAVLKIYNKEKELILVSQEFTGDKGWGLLTDLMPNTTYEEGTYFVSWEDKNYETELIPVPRFTTESSTNKELVFYFKDALTVKPMTAYDIAVKNGFSGTEEEWVKSIKGDPGDKGEPGEKGEGIEKVSMMNVLYNRLYGTLTSYNIPEKLNINVPFNVKTAQNGDFGFNYDVAINKNEVTKTYYVDIKNGNNSNEGSESSPFQSINRALRYGDADEIIVKEGVYGWSDGFSGYNQTKPFNIIGVGNVIIGAHRDNQKWVQNDTYSNVYQTKATNVTEIADYLNPEDVKFLDKKDSVEDVSNTSGSYYIDSSNIIYVRTHDSRVPDDKILPNMYNDAVKLTDNSKVYFENIKFTNTVRLTATTTNKQFFAKNCTFSIGSGGNALSIEGYDFNIIQNCIAENATMDGFNYHVKNGILPKVIEINCKGFNNGRNGADQNNGSTMHDGGKIIRIGGEYFNNGGPNVIDVNEGTVSVNIGVHAHSSRATKDTVSNSGFKNGNIGKSTMYLVNCIANESDYSVVTAESQESVTHIDNCLLKGEQGTV